MARTPVLLSNVAVIQKDGTNDDALDWVRATLVFTDENENKVRLYTEERTEVYVPRGAWSQCPIREIVVDDQTNSAPVEMPEPVLPLRGYQQRPVDKMVKKGIGVLEAPTGAGKTVMGLHIAARQRQRTLILVHTKDLMNQWVSSARNVLGIEIGTIGDGTWEEEGYPIVVAMVQTLMRYQHLPAEWLEHWGTVILDEAHRCPASSFAHVMTQMDAKHLYGVTATPTRRDGKHPQLHAIIGPIAARVNEDQLVDEGNLIRPSVTMKATKFTCAPGQRMSVARNQWQRQALYQKAITLLADDEERTQLIARTIARCGGKAQLVLSDRIEHLHNIERAIYDHNPDLRTMVVTGKMRSREREDALQAMRDGYLDVLLATQLADEGLDIVNLDTLHLTFPGRGLQKLQQKVGRVMRSAEGKRACHVYDYVDERIPVLRGQAKDRFEWYVGRGCKMVGWEPASGASIKKRMDRIRKQNRKG